MRSIATVLLNVTILIALSNLSVQAQSTETLKAEVRQSIQEDAKLAQVMVDKVFSFAELGFQEYETSKYLTDLLENHGFTIEHGIAGVPTAWMARWGSGKPVIALGSDLDCIPKASQKPGVAYHEPIVELSLIHI